MLECLEREFYHEEKVALQRWECALSLCVRVRRPSLPGNDCSIYLFMSATVAARDSFFISEGSGMDVLRLEWMPPSKIPSGRFSSQTLSAESSCGNVRKSTPFLPVVS